MKSPLTMKAVILQSLGKKQNYGLQLSKDIQEVTEDAIKPPLGNLATSLKKMLKAGLVKRSEEDGLRGRPRVIYALTSKGKKMAAEQLRIIKAITGKA